MRATLEREEKRSRRLSKALNLQKWRAKLTFVLPKTPLECQGY